MKLLKQKNNLKPGIENLFIPLLLIAARHFSKTREGWYDV
jgi:hypothetical protein